MHILKPIIVTVIGAFSAAVGGFDVFLKSLLILMGIDYALGLVVAGVLRKSAKSENGGLSSAAGWLGLAKKMTILLLIVVAVEIDYLLGSEFVRSSTIIFFSINEIISITEHAGTIGLPMPDAIKKAIDLLKGKENEHEKGN